MNTNNDKQIKLIYPELSYQLISLAYDVHNNLGSGYQEKYYQRAYEIALKKAKLKYKREEFTPLTYKGEDIGRYFVDFVVEDKIVVEFKVANFIHNRDIKQVLGYLLAKNLMLGIIVIVKKEGIKYKRIVNIPNN